MREGFPFLYFPFVRLYFCFPFAYNLIPCYIGPFICIYILSLLPYQKKEKFLFVDL